MASRSSESGSTVAGSVSESFGSRYGVIRAHCSQKGPMSTIRSRTTGKPASGPISISRAWSWTSAWQASTARPSTRSVQVPHIATRQEKR